MDGERLVYVTTQLGQPRLVPERSIKELVCCYCRMLLSIQLFDNKLDYRNLCACHKVIIIQGHVMK